MKTAVISKTPVKKRAKAKSSVEKKAVKKAKKTDVSASYNSIKSYEGKQYTGMKIGRMHRWNYDKADWKEKKITPDKWEFIYDTTKRRRGHAPEGSGVPVGTGFHWFILAHQFAEKLNEDDYKTRMVGIKFKLAHKRINKDNWSASGKAQQKLLIKILKDLVAELEKEPEESIPVPLEFEYNKKKYKGIGLPVLATCHDGACFELDVTLNKKNLGIIRQTPTGWKLSEVKSRGLVNAIGEQISNYYELE